MNVVTTLPNLAAEINTHHEQAQSHANEAVTHALIAGDALIKAKAQVKHGEWEDWLTANTVVSVRQSQRFMKLANNREDIEAKTTHVSDLTLRGALELLVEPKEQPFMDQVYQSIAEESRLRSEVIQMKERLNVAETLSDYKQVFDDAMTLSINVVAHRIRAERGLGAAFKKEMMMTEALNCDVATLSAIGLKNDVTLKSWMIKGGHNGI